MISSAILPSKSYLGLRGRHRGESAFIVGTGPSLLGQDLSVLRGKVTFATDRLIKWSDIPFTPTYHVVSELPHINEIGFGEYRWEEVQERFLCWTQDFHISGFTYVPKAPLRNYVVNVGVSGLGSDLAVANGRSSACVATQIALWMGCTYIYLVGCEMTLKGNVWDIEAPRQDNSVPKLLDVWDRVRADIELSGRHIFDCTVDGNLTKSEVLEYVPLEEAVA
jgi:hypothetical protein